MFAFSYWPARLSGSHPSRSQESTTFWICSLNGALKNKPLIEENTADGETPLGGSRPFAAFPQSDYPSHGSELSLFPYGPVQVFGSL